jgi:hypothetical protein
MDHQMASAPKRRLDAYGRLLRRGRVFARLGEGWAYDEIARQEGLTAERVRQIVREVLKKRPVDNGADHALLQMARLAPAIQMAGDAVLKGEVTAIAPLLKVLDRLDRCQRIASQNRDEDCGERQKLLDKFNQIAARLKDDKPETDAEAAEASGGGEAAAPEAADPSLAWRL